MNTDKVILFDYDGVLVDSLERNLAVAGEASRRLGHDIMPVKEDIVNMHIVTFEELGRIIQIPDAVLHEYSDTCVDILSEIETPITFFPGIEAEISRLQEKAFLGVITSNRAAEVNAQFAKAGLQKYFAPIVGLESGRSKGDNILRVMGEYQVPAANTYMVGDAASDIREAKKAGVVSVAVTWGYQSLETLEAENPDIVINSLGELIGHV